MEWVTLNIEPVWTFVKATDSGFRRVNDALTGYYRKDANGHKEYRSAFDGERFLSGLIDIVLKELQHYDLHLTIEEDYRQELPWVVEVNPDILQPYLGYSLRDYQRLSVLEMLRNERGIVTLPTGAGKTTVAAAYIKHQPSQCLYIVGQQNLADQTVDFFRRCKIPAAPYYGGCTCPDTQVIVSVINTASNLLGSPRMTHDKQRVMSIPLLICDEVHHASAYMYRVVGTRSRATRRYGLTATPFDNHKEPTYTDLLLTGLIGPEIVNVTTKELVDKGYLARPIVVFLKPARVKPIPGANSSDWHRIYPAGIVGNVERNIAIAEVTEALYNHGEKILLLVAQVEHGVNLLTLLSSRKIPARLSKGASECLVSVGGEVKRYSIPGHEVAQQFNEADEESRFVLIGTTLYDEGVDIPMASALIRAGSMKKSRKTKQRTGRVLRPSAGDRVWVIDFWDNEVHPILGYQSVERRKTDMSEGHAVYFGPEELESAGVKIPPGVFYPGGNKNVMRIGPGGSISRMKSHFDWGKKDEKE